MKFQSHSQAGQDRFVYELLVKPEGLLSGTFLDIGSNDPNEINNTIALEQLGWRGLLIDLNEHFAGPSGKGRTSPFLVADAVTIDWSEALRAIRHDVNNFYIDYVSLDVDEAQLDALRNLLNCGVRFRVATVEHDAYRFGEGRKRALRELMALHGYTLLTADVCMNHQLVAFEDWFVDAQTVNMQVAERFRRTLVAWEDLFKEDSRALTSAATSADEVVT